MRAMKIPSKLGAILVLAACALASIVGCSSKGDTTGDPASCPQAFYADADGSGLKVGPLPNEKCSSLCGKTVFSCSVATIDSGKASIECQPDC